MANSAFKFNGSDIDANTEFATTGDGYTHTGSTLVPDFIKKGNGLDWENMSFTTTVSDDSVPTGIISTSGSELRVYRKDLFVDFSKEKFYRDDASRTHTITIGENSPRPKYIYVLLQGAGGGGGGGGYYDGSETTPRAYGYQITGGAGGGAGGAIVARIDISTLNPNSETLNLTLTIGAGGAAGTYGPIKYNSNGSTNGSNGGSTILKYGNTTLLTAYGGTGGEKSVYIPFAYNNNTSVNQYGYNYYYNSPNTLFNYWHEDKIYTGSTAISLPKGGVGGGTAATDYVKSSSRKTGSSGETVKCVKITHSDWTPYRANSLAWFPNGLCGRLNNTINTSVGILNTTEAADDGSDGGDSWFTNFISKTTPYSTYGMDTIGPSTSSPLTISGVIAGSGYTPTTNQIASRKSYYATITNTSTDIIASITVPGVPAIEFGAPGGSSLYGSGGNSNGRSNSNDMTGQYNKMTSGGTGGGGAGGQATFYDYMTYWGNGSKGGDGLAYIWY